MLSPYQHAASQAVVTKMVFPHAFCAPANLGCTPVPGVRTQGFWGERSGAAEESLHGRNLAIHSGPCFQDHLYGPKTFCATASTGACKKCAICPSRDNSRPKESWERARAKARLRKEAASFVPAGRPKWCLQQSLFATTAQCARSGWVVAEPRLHEWLGSAARLSTLDSLTWTLDEGRHRAGADEEQECGTTEGRLETRWAAGQQTYKLLGHAVLHKGNGLTLPPLLASTRRS